MIFIGKGKKVYIVYDDKGNEVINYFIRSSSPIKADEIAKKHFGKNASVAETEI